MIEDTDLDKKDIILFGILVIAAILLGMSLSWQLR